MVGWDSSILNTLNEPLLTAFLFEKRIFMWIWELANLTFSGRNVFNKGRLRVFRVEESQSTISSSKYPDISKKKIFPYKPVTTG